MTDNKNKICIYHGDCPDGFAAAWIAQRAEPGAYQFVAGTHGDGCPVDVTNKHVLLVDFCYPRDDMNKIISKASSVVILDHHKSAREDAVDLLDMHEHVTGQFNMEKSGARLAWDWFFPDDEPPEPLLHIEDQDLWRFAFPCTRPIFSAITARPFEFAIWDWLMLEAGTTRLREEGTLLLGAHDKQVAEQLRLTQRWLKIGGYPVPVVCVPHYMASDAVHMMLSEMHPDVPFAASYYDAVDDRVFSLRANSNSSTDVSAIARTYGGGGHASAAGFRVPRGHSLARQ